MKQTTFPRIANNCHLRIMLTTNSDMSQSFVNLKKSVIP